MSLASAVPGAVPPVRRGCGIADLDATNNHLQMRSSSEATRRQVNPSNFTVDVNFHIASTEAYKDVVTDAVVQAQWEILQNTYAEYGIHLILNSTERIVDNMTGAAFLVKDDSGQWVSHQEEYDQYLKATRKGGYDAMNLYFYAPYSPGATGYCNFPTVVSDRTNSSDFPKDSCQISALTMPGITTEQGGFEEWNLGHLAIHEAGHWFGLNHTFAGGCSDTAGDFVLDTPAQGGTVYGCPADSDTCPSLPGLDPIHNFMGYTDDNW